MSARALKATIAKRPKDESGLSDSTCTPKWLADILPRRDVDPCSNERSHVKADVIYTLANGLDGLELPWMGEAFANWPFAAPLPFAQKAQHELREGNCTDLIVLCKMDPSTRWWAEIKRPVPGFALDLWIPADRIQYDEHPELIERRRLDRLAEALNEDPAKIEARRLRRVAKARKAGATDIEIAAIDGVLEVDGESTANFVSVLFHHRKHGTQPWWPFAAFADRWTLAGDEAKPRLAKPHPDQLNPVRDGGGVMSKRQTVREIVSEVAKSVTPLEHARLRAMFDETLPETDDSGIAALGVLIVAYADQAKATRDARDAIGDVLGIVRRIEGYLNAEDQELILNARLILEGGN